MLKTASFASLGLLIGISSVFVTPVLAQSANTAALQSLPELQSRLSEILTRPELAVAQVGVAISSVETGRNLFALNADKLLLPASNAKILTVSALFDKLTPGFRFRTSIYAANSPTNGVLNGDLTVYGRGDPTFAASFYSGDYLKGIDQLAANIASTGLKRIQGDLIGDESYFTGPKLGFSWNWDDLPYYYAAPVSALSTNDNALDVMIKPGAEVGAAGLATTGPATSVVRIVNETKTGPAGSKRNIVIDRVLGQNVIEVSGNVPIDDKGSGYVASIAVGDPAMLFVDLLGAALKRQGVEVAGILRVVSKPSESVVNKNPVELTFTESIPLSEIATQAMKMSKNLYAELFLRTLGETARKEAPSQANSVDLGIETLRKFLDVVGVARTAVMPFDGSGLSRCYLATAGAFNQVLLYMSKHRFAVPFYDTLPIAGVDGTLSGRLKGTPAEKNAHAKTGSLLQTAALSGYVTTAAGEKLVFSILINNHPGTAAARRGIIDEIVAVLAGFAVHS